MLTISLSHSCLFAPFFGLFSVFSPLFRLYPTFLIHSNLHPFLTFFAPVANFFVSLWHVYTPEIMTESFVIQSDIANLAQVEERLFHFCRLCNVGNYYSALEVATLQAVENAILHGNQSDPAKAVSLTFGTCRGGLFVEVSDQGQGFDHSQFGDLPTGESTRGEGIFVMRSLSDRMTFSEGGRVVRMEFDVNGIDPADALQRIAVLQSHYHPVAA